MDRSGRASSSGPARRAASLRRIDGRSWGGARIASLIGALLVATVATAHDFTITDAQVHFAADDTYCVRLTCDLDAMALGLQGPHNPAEAVATLRALDEERRAALTENLRQLFAREFTVRFDDRPAEFTVAFSQPGSTLAHAEELPTFLGVVAELRGGVPPDADTFVIQASARFKPLHMAIRRADDPQENVQIVPAGEPSAPFPLREPVAPQSALETARQYVVLGFEHIVPEGLDHILFVVGLFLLSAHMRPLLWQVTAFTVAHSITLALAVYGAVRIPSQIVEPLIAASIAYVAIENMVTTRLTPWRPAVVFGFGLLHGLGFAGVLEEIGLPRREFATALITFNVGVELGQLAVILAAFALVGWFRDKPWYRSRIVIPTSAVIAAIGLYWAVTRAVPMA